MLTPEAARQTAFQLQQGGDSDVEQDADKGEYYAVHVDQVVPPSLPGLDEPGVRQALTPGSFCSRPSPATLQQKGRHRAGGAQERRDVRGGGGDLRRDAGAPGRPAAGSGAAGRAEIRPALPGHRVRWQGRSGIRRRLRSAQGASDRPRGCGEAGRSEPGGPGAGTAAPARHLGLSGGACRRRRGTPRSSWSSRAPTWRSPATPWESMRPWRRGSTRPSPSPGLAPPAGPSRPSDLRACL